MMTLMTASRQSTMTKRQPPMQMPHENRAAHMMLFQHSMNETTAQAMTKTRNQMTEIMIGQCQGCDATVFQATVT
jgi:hypothetical protein